jgi:hypothetical protein
MSKPSIDQILANLINEVILGRAYLTIANGLRESDPVVLKSSPTFFGLTIEASLQMSQMYAAKLYDQTKGAVTVESLLERAKLGAATFKNGTPDDVSLVVASATSRIAGLQDIIRSIQKRRHEALAHLDPRTVIDSVGLATRAKLTISDLRKVFDETSAVLNDVMRLWQDTYAHMEFIGSDDYETSLELIAEAKHAQVDKWEKQFPDKPCDFPRPRTPRQPW